MPENALRETISAAGPVDLERMFEAGTPIIESIASAAKSLSRAAPTPVRELESLADNAKPILGAASSGNLKRHSRGAVVRVRTKSGSRAKLGQRTGRSLAVEEGRRTSLLVVISFRPAFRQKFDLVLAANEVGQTRQVYRFEAALGS